MKKLLSFITVLIVVPALFIYAKKAAPDYKFHSVYIYNFTKYIQWPNAGRDFKISILGKEQKIYDSFKMMADTKSSEGQQFIINQYASIDEVGACNILFVPYSQSAKIADVLQKYGNRNTLIITEKEGLVENGSGINFVVIDNRLKFEINKSALDNAGLKVSSQLMQMAIVK